jgi:hypothetical protein
MPYYKHHNYKGFHHYVCADVLFGVKARLHTLHEYGSSPLMFSDYSYSIALNINVDAHLSQNLEVAVESQQAVKTQQIKH